MGDLLLDLPDSILRMFGISIDSFRIAGGILVVTIAMSMINGKLGEDKQALTLSPELWDCY